jgi:uncharacterized protein (TIGR00297 family)
MLKIDGFLSENAACHLQEVELYLDWYYSGLFTIALFVVILIAEGLQKLKHLSSDATRKIVHVITGVFVAVTPFLFQSRLPILIICISFAIINFVAIRLGYLDGMHATQRKSYGTVFYPLALVALLLFCWENHALILVISMLILAFADPLAASVGQRVKKPRIYRLANDYKSLEGSATMFLATFMIVFAGLFWGRDLFPGYVAVTLFQNLWISLLIGILATVCEAISSYGSDNLTVPVGAGFFLHFMLTRLNQPEHFENIQLTLGLVLAAIVAFSTFKLHFLTASGAVSTFLLGTVVFGIGGWKFSIPILVFFILSSLLSKVGKQRKQKLAQTYQKSSRRDLEQVIANGGLAGVLVIFWNFNPADWIYYLYLASLASVTADTWATEIGFFSKVPPRFILNFKPVPSGTSGGLTILGTTASMVGAAFIAASGWLVADPMNLGIFTAIVFAGLGASLFDSLLGATIQAQFQCPRCQKITEKTTHCDSVKTNHYSGWAWIDNDVVNFLAAIFGVGLLWLGIVVFQL